jgi:hypothetical protein
MLDFVLHEVELSEEFKDWDQMIWVMFKVDGIQQPFSSPAVHPSNAKFSFPARLVLQLPDLAGAHMYVNLCSMNAETNRAKSMAMSRISLSALPVNSARRIRFPIMSCENAAVVAGYLSLTTAMHELDATYYSAPSAGPVRADDFPVEQRTGPYASEPRS